MLKNQQKSAIRKIFNRALEFFFLPTQFLTRKKISLARFLTLFLTRLARKSNPKITRLDPTRQPMTRVARDSNNFRLDPPLV